MKPDLDHETTPPPALRARVLRTLRTRGLLRPAGRWWPNAVRVAAGLLPSRSADWWAGRRRREHRRPARAGCPATCSCCTRTSSSSGTSGAPVGPLADRVARSRVGLSGYFVIEAANWEEAVALARTCPHLRYGGRIALRPVAPT
jgi:hypothetical protein